jgi:hypothetical protein
LSGFFKENDLFFYRHFGASQKPAPTEAFYHREHRDFFRVRRAIDAVNCSTLCPLCPLWLKKGCRLSLPARPVCVVAACHEGTRGVSKARADGSFLPQRTQRYTEIFFRVRQAIDAINCSPLCTLCSLWLKKGCRLSLPACPVCGRGTPRRHKGRLKSSRRRKLLTTENAENTEIHRDFFPSTASNRRSQLLASVPSVVKKRLSTFSAGMSFLCGSRHATTLQKSGENPCPPPSVVGSSPVTSQIYARHTLNLRSSHPKIFVLSQKSIYKKHRFVYKTGCLCSAGGSS